MEKREAELKAAWRRAMKLHLPGFLLLQYATPGAPDTEVVGLGVTTRWEFKHGTPDFCSPGLQELVCMRLAAADHCRYVLWTERRGIQRTLIVHPKAMHERDGWEPGAEAWCHGFDVRWLVEYVRKAHERGR